MESHPVTFRPFKFSGRQFLAIPNNNGLAILDNAGGNYGSYPSIDSFKDMYARGVVTSPLGLVNLRPFRADILETIPTDAL